MSLIGPIGLETACLIVNYPTSVKYSNQSCGHLCAQPESEGYIIPFSDLNGYDSFKDCKILGCSYPENKDKDAVDKLNKYLSNIKMIGYLSVELEIDTTRIDELMEAWWPVKGKISKEDFGTEMMEFKGYVAKSNCD